MKSIKFFVLLFLLIAGCKSNSEKESKLKESLLYLSEIQEIAWYEIEGNDIYIGFSKLPDDWRMIIKGAAIKGNEAINFGCHVWAVDASKRGWRPGDSSYYGEVTARYGKIER